MILLPKRIDTPRLILRPYRRSDLPHLPALIGDWEVARWLARSPYPYTDKDARDWLWLSRRVRWLRRGLPLAIVRADDQRLIGGIGIGFSDGEIGYWLGHDYWGQGYATEAVARLTSFGLGEYGLPSLWAAILPENRASGRVLEKVGFHYAGKLDYRMRDGITEALLYRLSRDEWKKVHG
ncbi:MAG: GNAT family N-acetyltransferase [Alphaproteobacteria bacterium]